MKNDRLIGNRKPKIIKFNSKTLIERGFKDYLAKEE